MTQHLHVPVLNALRTLMLTYASALQKRGHTPVDTSQLISQVEHILLSDRLFLDKVNALDQAINTPAFAPLKEYCFDLLMVNFLAAEAEKMDEDYLESEEWRSIEEKTILRGTELLSLLLYLNESLEDDVEITLHDFLTEFLLADEDEFQDEHHIYESIITNQHLLEAELDEMIETWKQIKDDSDIADLFIPMLIFFADPETDGKEEMEELMRIEEIPAIQVAILQAIYTFKNSFNSSIEINAN
jgi:hypothetical protein